MAQQTTSPTTDSWLSDIHLLSTNYVHSFPFLPVEMEKTLLLLSFFPESIIIIICHCFWLRSGCTRGYMYMCMFVWVCNLCGTAGTWSVHLAGVQRAAHRIMMTVAAASVFWGHERRIKTRERERRWREMKEMSMEEDQRTERGKKNRLQTGRFWRGSCRKTETNKRRRGQKGCVFVLDYFCGVASVCSSCGQWIMQKFMRTPVCQSQSALFRLSSCSGGLQTFMCNGKHIIDYLWQHSHQPAGAAFHRPVGVLWVCTSQETTDTLQQQSAGWDFLGSDHVVTPFLLPVQL